MRRSYPDGTQISAQVCYGNNILSIDSPFWGKEEKKEELFADDLLVFYSTIGGEKRVAVTDTGIFEGPRPKIKEWAATKWGMTFTQTNLKIFGKRFSYKGKNVWYYRLPFYLKTPDPILTKGHYLFSGFQMYTCDYLYVEDTARWYLIKLGTGETDPFNIGNYIYLVSNYKAYAYDFDFDEEEITVAKEVYCNPATTHIDNQGGLYYRKAAVVFFEWSYPGSPPDWGRGFDGIIMPADHYIGWEILPGPYAPGPTTVIFGNLSQSLRKFGHWPGLSFEEPYRAPWYNIDIDLYAVARWDMWAQAETVITMPTYQTTLYPITSPISATGRGYQKYLNYPQVFKVLASAGQIDYGSLSEQKEIWCAGDAYPYEASIVVVQDKPPPDPIATTTKTLNHKYGEFWTLKWGEASIITALNMDFVGSQVQVRTGETVTEHTMNAAAAYSGHYADSSKMTFLAFPMGSSPFGVYTIQSRSRNVNVVGSMGDYDISDDNPDWAEWVDQRALFTPYGEKPLTATEAVTSWGFLDGKGFLLQSLKTAVTHGNLMWVGGLEEAKDNLVRHLETTWDRIYGVMLCPGIGKKDQSYIKGQA